MTSRGSLLAPGVVALTLLLTSASARAFPPYRSTDADTAHFGTLEARIGLFMYERDDGQDAHTMPLLRLNFGLPEHVELLGETEWDADAGEVAEAALGAKWIPLFGTTSAGIETLALLPIPSSDGGAGIESLALVTFRPLPVHLHLNAGGFHDARPPEAESGWKASVLAELRAHRCRPGIELAAERVGAEPIDVRVGGGVIIDFGALQLRSGIHAGLTEVAPDVRVNVWVSTETDLSKWPQRPATSRRPQSPVYAGSPGER